MDLLERIIPAVLEGKVSLVKTLVEESLAKGISPRDILDKGVIKGMDAVSKRFQNEEFYIPDVLISSRAVHAGIKMVEPILLQDVSYVQEKVVIGTVAGDLHDIGKNLVAIFLRCQGYEVVDLGIDTSGEDFVEAIIEHGPGVVAMSALLTTTLPVMGETVRLLEEKNLRRNVQVIIGGAPVTYEYMKAIKADGYAADASQVPDLVAQCLNRLKGDKS